MPDRSAPQVVTTVPPSDASTRQDKTAGRRAVSIPSTLPYQPALRYALDHTLAHLVDLSLLVTPAASLFGPEDGRNRGLVEVLKNSRGQEGGLVPFELVSRAVLSLSLVRILSQLSRYAAARTRPLGLIVMIEPGKSRRNCVICKTARGTQE